MNAYRLFPALLLVTVMSLWPQTETEAAGSEDDPALLIGLSLQALVSRFGIPRSVYPVRGHEEWQDDVVFVYEEGDFYIIKDRVWQVGIKSAYRIQAGDSRSAVFLNFGEAFSSGEDYAVFPLKSQHWPLSLRCNFDSGGKVQTLFIYRADI